MAGQNLSDRITVGAPLFEKRIDKSFWYKGMTLSGDTADWLRAHLGDLEPGAKKNITISYLGRDYPMTLSRVAFNQEKYPNHGPMWRLLWQGAAPLRDQLHQSLPLLQAFFAGVEAVKNSSDEEGDAALVDESEEGTSRGRNLKIPDKLAAKVRFYVDSDAPDKWRIEIDGQRAASEASGARGNLKNEPLQKIVQGAPGTGKSFQTNAKTAGYQTVRTTFHPDSDYATFVGAYKPVKEDGKITYGFVPQAFTEAYVAAWKARAAGGAPVFLVVEEINRGNCAQVFGDLFQLLDRRDDGFSEYLVRPDASLARFLREEAFAGVSFDAATKSEINAKFSNVASDIVQDILFGKALLLPDNFYIWATMNTSDQSLFPIDSAFKRRWEWQYIPIRNEGKNWVIATGGSCFGWWSFLEKINAVIGSATHSEDKKLGYYFLKAKDGVISAERFVGKIVFYLWNDVFRDNGFDDACFKFMDGETERILSVQDFFLPTGAVNEDRVAEFLTNLGVAKAES